MEQAVRVKEVYPDGTATVMHLRESACSGDCHKCAGCGAAQEAILLRAENTIRARPGDLVTVVSDSGPVLAAAAVAYLMPLVLFFLGYLAGMAIWGRGAAAGCAAFTAGICLAVGFDRKVVRKRKPQYRITAFAEESLGKAKEKGDNGLD